MRPLCVLKGVLPKKLPLLFVVAVVVVVVAVVVVVVGYGTLQHPPRF